MSLELAKINEKGKDDYLEQVTQGTGLSLETVDQLAKELGDLKVYYL